jgi:hypothetical protein
MKLIKLWLVAALGVALVVSCSKDPAVEVPPAPAPLKPLVWVNPDLVKIADFLLYMPKGNQVIADGKDAVPYKLFFYDAKGESLTSSFGDINAAIQVKVAGKEVKLDEAMKATSSGEYKVEITANGITKFYTIIATTVEKKVVEIPLIFNFFSTDYTDKTVQQTLDDLVASYKQVGVDNVVFKLATIDGDGKPLARKGIKFWQNTGTVDDLDYTFQTKYKTKYAFNVYLLDIKSIVNAAGYASGSFIVLHDPMMKQKQVEGVMESQGFGVMMHEMGHIFGLKHVYRDDNSCIVQEGVNDIEACKRDNYKFVNGKLFYTSNCGKILDSNNIMLGGTPRNPDLWMTNDQRTIAKKTVLNLIY